MAYESELIAIAAALGAPQTRQETFITTATGATQDCSASPKKSFSLQATKTGSITSWTILLEGSIDGVTFTTILTHTNVAPGDGAIIASGATITPVKYWRLRSSAFSIGTGTNVIATGLAMN